VDESQIAADLKQGVLTLTLSKVVEAQPRKIAVAAS
jgi:HSP20 family molecular chaperone IbpA